MMLIVMDYGATDEDDEIDVGEVKDTKLKKQREQEN